MVNVDPESLRRDFPVSHALLMHDGTMTHQLTRLFGPVHAVQTGAKTEGETVTRWSTIYHTESGTPLLQARLVIASQNLPEGLMTRLSSGNRLFGGLVTEAGVPVRLTDRVLYRSALPGGAWGRRHRLLRADDGALLCDVDECLAEEDTLRRLLRAPLPDDGAK